MPQSQLEDALVQLIRAELIFRRGAPPDAEYTFKHALVGLTPTQAKQMGVKGTLRKIPSIDKAATACGCEVGDARLSCYAALDRVLTEQIVPWIPYMWANQVNVFSRRSEHGLRSECRPCGIRPRVAAGNRNEQLTEAKRGAS